MKLLASILLLLLMARRSEAASIGGAVTAAGEPVANAIVYLQSAKPALAQPPQAHAVIDQRNLEFVPSVLPLLRGTTVDFINSDDIQHNVFSPSPVANKFDIGTSDPTSVHSITFDKLGEAVILCNIHMEMEAHVVVFDEPWFAVTGGDGKYSIEGVPVGSYVAKVWRGRFLSTSRDVEVAVPERVDIDFRLPE